jgi:hypothetical protein
MGQAVGHRPLTSDDRARPVHVGLGGGHRGSGTDLKNSNAETDENPLSK